MSFEVSAFNMTSKVWLHLLAYLDNLHWSAPYFECLQLSPREAKLSSLILLLNLHSGFSALQSPFQAIYLMSSLAPPIETTRSLGCWPLSVCFWVIWLFPAIFLTVDSWTLCLFLHAKKALFWLFGLVLREMLAWFGQGPGNRSHTNCRTTLRGE